MDVEKVRADLTARYEAAEPLFDDISRAEQLAAYQSDVKRFFGDSMVLRNPDSTPWGGVLRGVDDIRTPVAS